MRYYEQDWGGIVGKKLEKIDTGERWDKSVGSATQPTDSGAS
jgi:hypothetical protein